MTLVIGNKNAREYQDFVGKRLRVGDFIAHATARSSSIDLHIYRIREIVDTDCPAYAGQLDSQRVETWDKAFKLKVVEYEKDVKGRLSPAKVWVSEPAPSYGSWKPQNFEDAKTRTISAVDRVIRLDLDV